MWVGLPVVHRGVDVGSPDSVEPEAQFRNAIPSPRKLALSCYLLADVDVVRVRISYTSRRLVLGEDSDNSDDLPFLPRLRWV